MEHRLSSLYQLNFQKMIKAVIIDDEINSRELLQNMLTSYCQNVEILGMAKDVSSGIEIIQKTKPQLVFLDIEMPGGNGFDILNALGNIHFKVVFVTGYDQYAIKAIKYAALDYILKPVDLEELKSAVEKAKVEFLGQSDKINFLQTSYNNSSHALDQIIISSHNSHHIVNLDDILCFEAMDGYSVVVIDSDIKYISTHSLNYYEELLPVNQFFRIHKSHLINCKKVVRYDSGRGGYVFFKKTYQPTNCYKKKAPFRFFYEPF